jgi:hypothetical protein
MERTEHIQTEAAANELDRRDDGLAHRYELRRAADCATAFGRHAIDWRADRTAPLRTDAEIAA